MLPTPRQSNSEITSKASSPDTRWHAPAPAKLNLFLHVTGQRADGYHTLQTVFQLLDWGDTLHFTRREDGKIIRTTALRDISQSTDLSLRAARLLQDYTGCSYGIEIEINKQLPIGGGLGGGSSDAATTLLVLNQLWNLHLSRKELQQLGLALGADVPFFIFGQNAFAEGIGEDLQALNLSIQPWWLIVTPPILVSTADIFSVKELTRGTKNIRIADFLANWNPYSASTENVLRNDLQPVVMQRYADIAAVLNWFDTVAPLNPARMTGSGASVFAAFEDEASALAVQAQVPSIWRSHVAPSMQQHPLLHYSN